jgi:DNA-binding transcriptional LysR family regulator
MVGASRESEMPQLPDFEAWAIFAKVAERGSFSQAADELGLGKTTVSKAITRLEERLGTTLLHRTTRRLSLTESGRASLERALRILADGEAVEAEILDDAAIPRGPVRIACMGAFGVRTLAPLLPEFMAGYPEVEIDLHIADDPVDIIGGGFDLAIRLGPEPDSSMRISRLTSIPILVVAAPAFFETFGRPAHPTDLARMPTLEYSHILLGPEWALEHAEHGSVDVRITPRIRINNAAAALPVVIAGQAIARMPDVYIRDELEAGVLIDALPGWRPAPLAVNVITPPGKARPARVRVFIDFLRGHLAKASWPDAAAD